MHGNLRDVQAACYLPILIPQKLNQRAKSLPRLLCQSNLPWLCPFHFNSFLDHAKAFSISPVVVVMVSSSLAHCVPPYAFFIFLGIVPNLTFFFSKNYLFLISLQFCEDSKNRCNYSVPVIRVRYYNQKWNKIVMLNP